MKSFHHSGKTFFHSGDMGDIIYALPTIRALGGGELFIYKSWPGVRTCKASMEFMRPLLVAQPYITDVRYTNAYIPTVNLDVWRHRWRTDMNIAEMHANAMGVGLDVVNEPWLTVAPRPIAPVVIARSERYRRQNFPWCTVVQKYSGKLAFVGLEHEHDDFCRRFGDVPWYQTFNMLELAQVIAGAKLFIGNQSSPYAIAEGLKQNTIQEVSPSSADCIFVRRNAGYGIDELVFLPEIDDASPDDSSDQAKAQQRAHSVSG